METSESADARLARWLERLDERHLANLSPPEVARALRALSSCYVERRSKLGEGGALASAGKRAAFALFYAVLHLVVVRQIARVLGAGRLPLRHIYDLGCGTGAAGAAVALESPLARVAGSDRHPWAVAEANWTYRQLGLDGRAVRQDLSRVRLDRTRGALLVAAYTVNELSDGVRVEMLPRLLDAGRAGARLLIIEPIARRVAPWWGAWEASFIQAGGRSDEWRFPPMLPKRQRDLGRAAGLNLRELTARSLFLDPAAS